MDIDRINYIKQLISLVPGLTWHYIPEDDFSHWEIWAGDFDVALVQDDSGVPPDPNFIKFILQAREMMEELLKFSEKKIWISVKDRLPELKKEVLTYRKQWGFNIESLDYLDEGVFYFTDSGNAIDFWMPLPEPPKM